ncbi:hypothetical protein ANN_06492 [Periplaneta americana]|uniref:Reverse transcriptase domain-containing protein n=1 Tax=Periplaneta americana TaxID=6978 RepID=A0ABQ8TFR5_PERAM|nr:hypothetical protein ANN_06492 [Periplaneta americana]
MSPGSNTESYPAFAHIGLRENPGKNLNQKRILQGRETLIVNRAVSKNTYIQQLRQQEKLNSLREVVSCRWYIATFHINYAIQPLGDASDQSWHILLRNQFPLFLENLPQVFSDLAPYDFLFSTIKKKMSGLSFNSAEAAIESFNELVSEVSLENVASSTEDINTKNCSEFMTISLISHSAKILLRILNRRLYYKMEEQLKEVQFDFRKGKGTRDAIGLLRTIGGIYLEKNKVYVLFVDLEKAFDRVDWNKLMGILKKIGVDWKNMGGVIVGGRRIKCIRFTNDMALAEEKVILRDMLLDLNDRCEQYGMKINANKTKTMVIGRKIKKSGRRRNDAETDMKDENELVGSLAEKKLPTEGCTGRNGEREESSGQKKISDDRQHYFLSPARTVKDRVSFCIMFMPLSVRLLALKYVVTISCAFLPAGVNYRRIIKQDVICTRRGSVNMSGSVETSYTIAFIIMARTSEHRANKTKTIGRKVKKVHLRILNEAIEQVDSFRDLGCTISSNMSCCQEVKRRITMAKEAFKRKRSIFCGHLEKELWKRLVKCFVWSVACMGQKRGHYDEVKRSE